MNSVVIVIIILLRLFNDDYALLAAKEVYIIVRKLRTHVKQDIFHRTYDLCKDAIDTLHPTIIIFIVLYMEINLNATEYLFEYTQTRAEPLCE